jgi:D-serine deaminase-like pyridoxal phosphate-dependent protein
MVGDLLETVDTPALVLDHSSFRHNLDAVAQQVAASGLRLRPHAKAHKSVAIAREQLAAGAIGICCQKVSEAEVFVEAGIADILVTNQIAGPLKADRLARLATRCRVGICVDDPVQVNELVNAARAHQVSIDVYVELDVGMGRCGVVGSQAAVDLARQIVSHAPTLRFAGLQAYHGRAQHVRDPGKRADAIGAAARLAKQAAEHLAQAGIRCEQITGGGTGTLPNELASQVYTEVQPGSYVLMDSDYAANQPDDRATPLRHALYLLTTVISARTGHAVLDAGLKAMSAECGLPVSAEPGWRVTSISDEHLVLRQEGASRELRVGDRVMIIPSHCDPTVNLHDWMLRIDGGRVESVWPIDARGAVF